ncbi:phosphoadenosine phosphosulfate reductase domain-containing protein [Paenibacillus xylanilyticus]|uniref:phosphoadenosine phosphosulfate reductase domain-containing protein n=1 Tax=Paenibacillus xylanilyticus TaxID=248903 RepID=UPI001C30FD08|nr:phosphoadenosine phosphosulfate reductase family protein [Paenibacillus xylanilyticus]
MANSNVQLSFEFLEDILQDQPQFIRDRECNEATPVVYGYKSKRIYGNNTNIYPNILGRTDTPHMKKIYLEHIDPLESYHKIFVLFSGGKDSVASVLDLLEKGVPQSKIILLHHDIDGGSNKKMDWPATKPYCTAFAAVFGLEIRFSYREEGFWGEVYRLGSKRPVQFQDADGKMKRIEPKSWSRSGELKELLERAEEEGNLETKQTIEDELKSYGYRYRFPAKSPNLQTRYCSSALKIEVSDVAIKKQLDTQENCKILIVSGERRGESNNRAKYNMMELHRAHAPSRKKRFVHHYRNIIDYSEKDVWEVLKRNRVIPHPCYVVGWGRASCACCIFSSPSHFAGIKEILPDYYENIVLAEIDLNFTLDNKLSLNEYVGNAPSCVQHNQQKAIHQLVTGEITPSDIILEDKEKWTYPAGAFRHGIGGPC